MPKRPLPANVRDASPALPAQPRAPRNASQGMSLRVKLLIAFALVALLGVGTVALVANQVTSRQFTLYLNAGGTMRAQRWAPSVIDYYARTGSWAGVEEMLVEASSARPGGQGRGRGMGPGMTAGMGPSEERFLIVDPEGQVVADTEGELVGEPLEASYVEKGAPLVVDGNMVGTLLATTRDLSGQGEPDRQFIEAVNRAVLWAVLLVAAASLVAAAFLSRQLVSPLRQLTVAAEAMAGGDLSQRVHVRARDEAGELGHAFNQMAADLESAQTQRRQMTADIAHELRNPLSVIRGNLEALLDGVYPADVEHLTSIHEETMLLQRLVEDLRLLSLADAGQLQLVRTDVDVAVLLNGIADSAWAVAEDKGISWRVDVPPEPLVVDGDADRLRQVIGNLVGNALRYTPEGGEITLRGQREGGQVRMQVSDTGPGIAPEDLPHVFDRFHRGDTARDRASGGSGLGLAIARALVQAHGAEIDVESASGRGTTFTISGLRVEP